MKKNLIKRISEYVTERKYACDVYESNFVLGYKWFRDATTLYQRVEWANFCIKVLDDMAKLDRRRANRLEHYFEDEVKRMRFMVELTK